MKIKIKKLHETTERKIQDIYIAKIILSIKQSKDVDRTKVMNFIRAIPHVTTIRREREISTSKASYVAEFSIKIVLHPGANIKKYIDSVLRSGIRKIEGVLLQSVGHLEKIV